jgi:cellulose biosynthesis protein BcsQ
LPRILAVANQKGGVGKTTTAINLGTALAAVGETVLIVDLDPQGNASTGIGVPPPEWPALDLPYADGRSLLKGRYRRIGHSPAPLRALHHGSFRSRTRTGRIDRKTYRLADAIAALVKRADPNRTYSYILVDCPPSLNLLTINALSAADAILVPLQCEFFALEGLSQLIKTVERVKASLNPRLTIQGVVLTMFDRATICPSRWPKTFAACWATRSTRQSYRGMSGCPRRPPTASRSSSMTTPVSDRRPISAWPRKSSAASANFAPPDRFDCETNQSCRVLKEV